MSEDGFKVLIAFLVLLAAFNPYILMLGIARHYMKLRKLHSNELATRICNRCMAIVTPKIISGDAPDVLKDIHLAIREEMTGKKIT